MLGSLLLSENLAVTKTKVGFPEADALHRRTIEAEEQKQRAELFSAIEKHLDNISRAN